MLSVLYACNRQVEVNKRIGIIVAV